MEQLEEEMPQLDVQTYLAKLDAATDALARSMARARRSADAAVAALDAIPPSRYRDALESVALYSVERSL